MKINILYISNAAEESVFNEAFKDASKTPSQAAQKYHNLLVEGFAANGQEIKHLSIMPISKATYKKVFFSGKKYNSDIYRYMPVLNIRIIRNIWMFIYVFFYVLLSCLKNKTVVVCDVLNTTVSWAVLAATAVTSGSNIGIVTDVPTKRATAAKGIIAQSRSKLSFGSLKNFDRFVFLTEAMNSLINTKNKPYIVLEGHVDVTLANRQESLSDKHDKRVCLYAGSLKRIYGIEYLVKAFVEANVPNSELHIYGAGDYETELQKLCESNPNVRFFGIKPNSAIVEEERRATLLINPRPTNEEYTKYSFPSKNMEYMSSGTPLLTTNLPGMPEEYKKYVFLIEKEDRDGLKDTLCAVLSKSDEELFAFGKAAKSFVMQEKNCICQAKKILEKFF